MSLIITDEEAKALGLDTGRKAPKQSKYRNQKTETDGIIFDSRKEAQRYWALQQMVKTGEITGLSRQIKYPFVINGLQCGSYIADFQYTVAATGRLVVEDVKSVTTRRIALYRMKVKLMLACHGIKVVEV